MINELKCRVKHVKWEKKRFTSTNKTFKLYIFRLSLSHNMKDCTMLSGAFIKDKFQKFTELQLF